MKVINICASYAKVDQGTARESDNALYVYALILDDNHRIIPESLDANVRKFLDNDADERALGKAYFGTFCNHRDKDIRIEFLTAISEAQSKTLKSTRYRSM